MGGRLAMPRAVTDRVYRGIARPDAGPVAVGNATAERGGCG
jgi:hypothetical protein